MEDGILSLGIAERNQLVEDVLRRDRETAMPPDPVDMANAWAFLAWLERYKITAAEARTIQDAWTEAGEVFLIEWDHYGTAYVYRQAEPGAVLISDDGSNYFLVPAGEMDSSPPVTGWPPDEDESEEESEDEEAEEMPGAEPYLIRSCMDAYPEFTVRADSQQGAADRAARRLYGRRCDARGDVPEVFDGRPYQAYEPAVGEPSARTSIGALFFVYDCDDAGRMITTRRR